MGLVECEHKPTDRVKADIHTQINRITSSLFHVWDTAVRRGWRWWTCPTSAAELAPHIPTGSCNRKTWCLSDYGPEWPITMWGKEPEVDRYAMTPTFTPVRAAPHLLDKRIRRLLPIITNSNNNTVDTKPKSEAWCLVSSRWVFKTQRLKSNDSALFCGHVLLQ